MNLKTRILGVSAGVALAVGMAGPAFAGAPVVETGTTAYDQGSMATRGGCSTIAIGTIVNTAKTSGMTSKERDLTTSTKGYPRSSADAAALRVGQCSLQQRLGVSGTAVNFGGINYVNKDVAKFGTKLTTANTDCNSSEGSDQDERSLSGKLGITYSDLTKTDAYIRVQGFDTATADKVWLTGIVTKGEAVGATIGGNVWFSPAYKAKTATGYYGSAVADDPKTAFPENGTLVPSFALAPGYAADFVFTAQNALGCAQDTNSNEVVDAGTEATEAAGIGLDVGDPWFAGGVTGATDLPGIDLIGLGAGSAGGTTFTSALGTTADGIQFLL